MKYELDLLDRERMGREEGIKAGREEGIKAGREEGMKEIIKGIIKLGRKKGIEDKNLVIELKEICNISEEEARIYLEKY